MNWHGGIFFVRLISPAAVAISAGATAGWGGKQLFARHLAGHEGGRSVGLRSRG